MLSGSRARRSNSLATQEAGDHLFVKPRFHKCQCWKRRHLGDGPVQALLLVAEAPSSWLPGRLEGGQPPSTTPASTLTTNSLQHILSSVLANIYANRVQSPADILYRTRVKPALRRGRSTDRRRKNKQRGEALELGAGAGAVPDRPP